MRSMLAVGFLGCAACLPQAWEEHDPASALVPTARTVYRVGGAGGGLAGGMGGFGGMAGGGAGGGMPPIGGGSPRPLVPEVTGSFTGGQGLFARGPLRSTTLATIPNTRQLVAVVADADAVFVLSTPNRKLPLPADSRPSSIAVSPDGLTAWVALRGRGAVARVVLSTGESTLVPVGAEPTGIALSPSGKIAVVATFGERTVALVDTMTLGFSTVDVGGHPRALTITNNGDANDDDEAAWVTLFYGEPLAEGTNGGRRGVVLEISLGTKAVVSRVYLAPMLTGQCVPNQLYAIAEQAGRLYVTSVCASPAAPPGPNRTERLRAGLSVIDRATRSEIFTSEGSRVLQPMVPQPSLMANPVDVAPSFMGSVVVLSQGANSIQNADFPVSARAGLSPFYMMGMGPQVEDPAAGVPTGILAVDPRFYFVLDATGRRVLQHSSLDPMMLPVAWPFETLPPENSPAYRERLGRRHFATAEGLWSSQNSVSCVSCHPDGLTDGLTWMFAAGPRQTPSLAGTLVRGQLNPHRAQGWTATADEISDVEHLVRTLAGGTGAISLLDGRQPLSLVNGVSGPGGLARHDGLSASSRDLSLDARPDWIEVEAWISSLPRPPASARLDLVSVARGRGLFASAGCPACHGGPLWTVSRVPYVPSFEKNGSAPGDDGQPANPTGLRLELRSAAMLWNPALNTDTFKVAPETVTIDGGQLLIGPERITCVLRDVGTFQRNDPLEVKSNGQPAQGEKGFNPPSLFGVATSAPYLHHGKAKTLTELFSPAFARHHQAGLPGFLAAADGGVEQAQVADLISFLESIDEQTTPFAQPVGTELCGTY